MRKKKLLILLVAVLLSGTLIGCGGRGALADEPMPIVPLSEEMEIQIKEDFLAWKRSEPNGHYYDTLTVEDVHIWDYINTYRNGVVLQIQTNICMDLRGPAITAMVRRNIGGYGFWVDAGSIWLRLYSITTSEFMILEDAYETNLLSRAEIRDIWLRYGDHRE